MKFKRQLKNAFLILLGVITVTVTSGVLYLESESFGSVVKRLISERSPQQLGIVGDFSNLKLYFFPPGVGIANPKIHVQRENIAKIPVESDIEAKELRIRFAPIQMLSGTLEISRVEVNSGAVQAHVFAEAFKPSKKTPKAKLGSFSFKDLFQLQVDGIHFEDTFLNIEVELPQSDHPVATAEFVVKNLDIVKTIRGNKSVLLSNALVNAVKVEIPPTMGKIPIKEAHQLQWSLELTDEGLKLNPFDADLAGIHVRLNGNIRGDIFDPKSDLKLVADSSIETDLATFFSNNLRDDDWKGHAKVFSRLEARVADIQHTLKATYEVDGESIEWKTNHASKVKGEGSVDLARGQVELKKLDLEDHSDATSVGKCKIENFLIPLQFNEGFQAKLDFQNADVHWLGGTVIKDVYPLAGKVSGSVTAHFAPGAKKRWKLSVGTDLRVDHFALTNQNYQAVRPLRYTLKPPVPIGLKGGLELSPQGLEFKSFSVVMPRTNLNLTGGIYAKDGFGFEAMGPIDLRDIGEIVQKPIRGVGELRASLHGSAANVVMDFNTKLKDVSYLDLLLGDVQGTITYDDGIYELRFNNVKANKKNTFYSLKSGFLDLSGGDDIHLPIQINTGRIEDLAAILDPLIQKVHWYPKDLKGEVHGTIEVGGKVDLPRLEIHGNLEGSDWILAGERARKLKMDAGLDKGVYFAHDLDLFKTNGEIKGDIDFNTFTDELNWDFVTEGLSLVDVDFVERLEIPARSKFEIQSKGSGRLDHLKSKTQGRFYQTEVKGENLEPSKFNLDIGESTLRANIQIFGNKLASQIKYALTPKQPSSVHFDFNEFDFTPLLLVLNPKLLDDAELDGKIDGKVQLDFLSTQFELARGDIKILQYHLAKAGFKLDLVDPISLPIQLGYFNLAPAKLQFKNSAVVVSGSGQKGEVNIRAQGQLDMALAEFVSSSVLKMNGLMDTEINLSGPLKQLRVNGDLSFSGAKAQLRSIQTPIEDMDGTIRLRQGTIFVQSIDSSLGEAPFTINGKIDTFTDRFPTLDLKLQFENNRIKLLPLTLVQPRGTVFIRGEVPPYSITGNLELSQALWSRSFSQSGSSTAKGERFAPVDREKQITSGLFDLDLNVNANQGFFAKNEIIDAEFKGRFRLMGPPENPKILGEGQLVQGRVLLRDRSFVFDNVKIEFDDPYQINPKFTATATAEVNQYKIKVLAYGKSDQWKAEFSSTPFLAENEIYSLLASGSSTSSASRFQTKDRSYVNQGEAASLILHSLDFSRDIQNRTGLQFDVQEADDSFYATSVFKPQTVGENVAAPKLVIKRQLSQKIDLSVGSTVGVGTASEREVSAEYKLTKGLSVLGVWNNTEEIENNIDDNRTSFGLDLKFNQKFK